MRISPDVATADDVAEICVRQRCCRVTEAVLNDTLDIPALHETLDDVAGWVASHHVWTVRLAGRLIGGVRAHQQGNRWEIGRLMVAPDQTGRGLGRALLVHAERAAPVGVEHLDLFTGARSARNRRMYERAGYRESTVPRGRTGHPTRSCCGKAISTTCAAGCTAARSSICGTTSISPHGCDGRGLRWSHQDVRRRRCLSIRCTPDFVDVIALLNQYSEDDLVRLAGEKDRGFTTETFAVSLRLVRRIVPRRWEVAGVSPEQAAVVTTTLLDWADRLDA